MSQRNVEEDEMLDALWGLVASWRKRQSMCEQAVFCVREERARADTYEFCAEELEAALNGAGDGISQD